ncbi:hypothetical protein [Azospirillum lipoferum]|uniref:Uncharacterized protein n=1 Tax=Azospirillum lipoferum (strain 4B) TaxID=862719 RepID=G7Z5G7_AZOL4|nr:hypothetical protein [Azospirillum lipoferum]CBS87032.1 Protein of unknown function [Azospirillum lipoferum 4B]
MTIPSHRAAAEVPTPAHTFELRNGELVNPTGVEEAARKAAEAPETAAAPVAKSRRPASDAPAGAVPSADQ